jgi:anthranilate synthase component 1
MEVKRTDLVMKSLSGERFTPFSLANKLGASAILESASFTHGKDRYSILLVKEAFRIVQEPDRVVLHINRENRASESTAPRWNSLTRCRNRLSRL